jgi:hypothetical protein
MQLIEGALGNTDLIFPADSVLRQRIALPHPVSRARAFLRGFDVAFEGEDQPLVTVQVTLDVAYVDDPSHVDVIARVVLRAEDPAGAPIHIAVSYTLMVE